MSPVHLGIGLPTADPAELLDWAKRADDGPFRTIGLLDRLVYPNPEPLVTLAMLAGATRRVRVQTEVLLVPLREPALLAKQAATLDAMSGGRFTLGVGIGGRADDHAAAGVPDTGKGARMDATLATLRRVWAGEPYGADAGPIGPAPVTHGGPEVLVGAFQAAALRRVAAFADGFLAAADPSWAGGLIDTVRREWAEHGRTGSPRIVGQVNVALGPESVIEDARARMGSYYAFTGRAQYMVDGMRTDAAGVREAIAAFADLGADEVVLYCHGRDPDQVGRLAELA